MNFDFKFQTGIKGFIFGVYSSLKNGTLINKIKKLINAELNNLYSIYSKDPKRFFNGIINYTISRIKSYNYIRQNPGLPWLTKDGNLLLQSLLTPSDIGIEFGSGRSTIWFSKKINHLISIESDKDWYLAVNERLNQENIVKVEYSLIEDNGEFLYKKNVKNFINELDDNSLDFALVDGIHRDIIANLILKKIKKGGMLIIDNIEWYLPSKSNAPQSIKNRSLTKNWEMFLTNTKNWNYKWTSNGVWDTAIWFKPA